MAIPKGNIPALDQEKVLGVGLALPFTSNAISGSDGLFRVVYTTLEQLKYNMINYFLTSRGERPLNPDFGSKIQEFVFEPNSPNANNALRQYVAETIDIVFPAVNLQDIVISPEEDNNLVTITIKFTAFTDETQLLEFSLPTFST